MTTWQPKWGTKPALALMLRFVQSGRSLRTKLSLGDLNLNKSNVFTVSHRPVSADPKNNRRASLLVPTYHGQRTARLNNPPAAITPTDDVNFLTNNDSTTTVTGSDVSNYYSERYGLSNRASIAGYGANRNSYYSMRQRYSMHDPPSSSSYTFSNRNRPVSYTSDDEEEEDEEDLMNHPEFGINATPEFHHVITTSRGMKAQEEAANLEAKREKNRASDLSRRNTATADDKPSDGGCCVVM